MARAKKDVETITSLGTSDDKLLVQKSSPLFGLWKSELTLAEFKILDTYLSRIDSHNEEKRSVVFKKGELERILGVQRIRTEELDERLKHLMTTVKIEDSNKKGGFTRISLFEKAVVEQDENGLWQVEMICTPSAMKYFFNIENLGYLLYKLRCIATLSSRYTYILFLYLESNKFRKTWTIELSELKSMLNCNEESCYSKFKVFNDRLLKRVKAEIDKKTELKYNYEPVKKGKNVVAIKFTYLSGNSILKEKEIIDIDINPEDIELWENLLTNNEGKYKFNKEQIKEIREILVTIPHTTLPYDTITNSNSIEFRWYHYISQKIATMERIDSENKIKNKFSYLVKMIKKDAGL